MLIALLLAGAALQQVKAAPVTIAESTRIESAVLKETRTIFVSKPEKIRGRRGALSGGLPV